MKNKLVLLSLAVLSIFTLSIFNIFSASAKLQKDYKYGKNSMSSDQKSDNQKLYGEWTDWKKQYVTSEGAGGFLRVQRDKSTDFDTVSEGIGYGMLLACNFDDHTVFDQLYKYAQSHFNSNGLMSWRINKYNNVEYNGGGFNAATDADEDIAMALILAENKWGSNGNINYANEAKKMLNSIIQCEVEKGTYVLKPGDVWGGSDQTNPSYFTPAWYKVFAKFTGNNEWLKVADKCYEILDNINKNNNSTGLVPDWCRADGSRSGGGYDYTYDAVRISWRLAVDYSWFCDNRAKNTVSKLVSFMEKTGVKNIKDGYKITGELIGQWHNATFVSGNAPGIMFAGSESFAKEMYKEVWDVKETHELYNYYGNTLRLLVLLYLTGNFECPVY